LLSWTGCRACAYTNEHSRGGAAVDHGLPAAPNLTSSRVGGMSSRVGMRPPVDLADTLVNLAVSKQSSLGFQGKDGQRNKASLNHWDQLQPYTSLAFSCVEWMEPAAPSARPCMARHS